MRRLIPYNNSNSKKIISAFVCKKTSYTKRYSDDAGQESACKRSTILRSPWPIFPCDRTVLDCPCEILGPRIRVTVRVADSIPRCSFDDTVVGRALGLLQKPTFSCHRWQCQPPFSRLSSYVSRITSHEALRALYYVNRPGQHSVPLSHWTFSSLSRI